MNPIATDLKQRLELVPHPEGGFYRETYRDRRIVTVNQPDWIDQERNASTAIYYLLNDGNFSSWHKVRSDEVWHYCCGSPLSLYVISQQGELDLLHVGNPLQQPDCQFHQIVKKDQWFAAEPRDPESYTLVSCTVAPGFDFRDFELAETDILLEQYPQHSDLIQRFSPTQVS